MKGKEFIKRLKRAGCEIDESRGKGGHCQVTYNGARPVLYLKMVCKQLGLDPSKVL